jgi:putative ABC transport system permease protein
LPIYGITTAEALSAAGVNDTRIVMQLLAAFAVIAVLLAAIGIWGVVSYSVAQRRRELGIRMALGARTGQAVGLVLRHGLVSAVIGVVIGTLGAIGLTRYLGTLLYEVDPGDPTAFVSGAALLFAVALLAAWLPARQATKVDPAETLRSD